MIHHVLIREAVEVCSGHARLHLRNEQIEHLGREPAGPAHAFERLSPVKRHPKACLPGGVKSVRCGNLGHGPDINLSVSVSTMSYTLKLPNPRGRSRRGPKLVLV